MLRIWALRLLESLNFGQMVLRFINEKLNSHKINPPPLQPQSLNISTNHRTNTIFMYWNKALFPLLPYGGQGSYTEIQT